MKILRKFLKTIVNNAKDNVDIDKTLMRYGIKDDEEGNYSRSPLFNQDYEKCYYYGAFECTAYVIGAVGMVMCVTGLIICTISGDKMCQQMFLYTLILEFLTMGLQKLVKLLRI